MSTINDVKHRTQSLPLSDAILLSFWGEDDYEPRFPELPSSELDAAGLQEREVYYETISAMPGMTAARKGLYDLWIQACRTAVAADASTRCASLAQASTLENALRLWWEEVYSPSGLVRALREQANLLSLFVLWCRYGDYAAEALNAVKELVSNKNYLKHLYAGKPWTEADVEIQEEKVKKKSGPCSGHGGVWLCTPYPNQFHAFDGLIMTLLVGV
jgi:hypothetical protein